MWGEGVEGGVLGKGILRKEVEDEGGIGKGVREGVKDGFGGRMGMGCERGEKGKRGGEVEKSMDGEEKGVERVREGFKGVWREEMREMVMMGEGFKEEKEEKEKEEGIEGEKEGERGWGGMGGMEG